MPDVSVLYALVPADDVDDLQTYLRRRLFADELAVHDAAPGSYSCVDERLGLDLRWARRGAALGALIGAVVGFAIAWIGGTSSAASFGLLAAGGAAVAALIGAVIGMQMHEVLDDDPAATITVQAGDRRRVLEIRSEHSAFWARRVLTSRSSVCLLESLTPHGR